MSCDSINISCQTVCAPSSYSVGFTSWSFAIINTLWYEKVSLFILRTDAVLMESMALFEDAFINAAGTACSIVGYVLIVVLFLFGMTYTIKTKGVQFRMLKESVRLTFSGLAGEAVKKKNTFAIS